MPKHLLTKRCPLCKYRRKFIVPPDHCFAEGRQWHKINDTWICYWCVARSKPNGELKLRKELKSLRQIRKLQRKQDVCLAHYLCESCHQRKQTFVRHVPNQHAKIGFVPENPNTQFLKCDSCGILSLHELKHWEIIKQFHHRITKKRKIPISQERGSYEPYTEN
jgi:hypothetical protein